jgi:hypothetical protein
MLSVVEDAGRLPGLGSSSSTSPPDVSGRVTDVRVRWRRREAVVLLAVGFPATASAATEQVIAARDVGADVGVDDHGMAFLVSPVAPH